MKAGEKLEAQFASLIRELDQTSRGTEFEEEDPFRFVRDAAALWERTLKRCTLTTPPRDPSLNNLIDALQFDNVDQGTRSALHRLRRAANQGKHDPASTISTAVAGQLIEATMPALGQLEASGVRELAATAKFDQRRRYVVEVIDHYASGETEYGVYLIGNAPDATQFMMPSAIEKFAVKFGAEDSIKAQLVATGHASFAEKTGEAFTNALDEGDFIARWDWEGNHRDLVAAFAPHQWHVELIPGLSRADHIPSVISAAALALVDIARPADWKDLVWKMSTDFGIWRRGTVVERLARAAIELVGGSLDRSLYGPRWISRQDALEIASPNPRLEVDGFVLVVDERDVVVVGIDLGRRGFSISVLGEEDLRRPDDPLSAG